MIVCWLRPLELPWISQGKRVIEVFSYTNGKSRGKCKLSVAEHSAYPMGTQHWNIKVDSTLIQRLDVESTWNRRCFNGVCLLGMLNVQPRFTLSPRVCRLYLFYYFLFLFKGIQSNRAYNYLVKWDLRDKYSYRKWLKRTHTHIHTKNMWRSDWSQSTFTTL